MKSEVALASLVQAINSELAIDRFKDYCPNGLQIEGRPLVSRIVSGVTASMSLIDAASDYHADAILVHHGYFWRGEDPVLVGMKGRRISALFQRDISLLAYHLPLDAHPYLGNNAQLASRLGFTVEHTFRPDGVGFLGAVRAPMTKDEMVERIFATLGKKPLLISGGDHPIRSIAWCSGGAQSFLQEAAALGADAYLSGEISEQTTHEAREMGIHYFAAGHHATERFGVQALGNWCADRFGIEHQFVDIPNPA